LYENEKGRRNLATASYSIPKNPKAGKTMLLYMEDDYIWLYDYILYMIIYGRWFFLREKVAVKRVQQNSCTLYRTIEYSVQLLDEWRCTLSLLWVPLSGWVYGGGFIGVGRCDRELKE